MNIVTKRKQRKFLSIVLIVAVIATQVGWSSVSYAGSPEEDLKVIQYKYYFRGKYDQAIEKLQTFLARTDLAAGDIERAREFLAASYILSGAGVKGRDQFVKMLNENNAYGGPDPAVFKSEVVSVFTDARNEMAATRLRQAPVMTPGDAPAEVAVAREHAGKPIYKKWWFYAGIAGGIILLGALASPEEDQIQAPADRGTVSVGVTLR